jgi:8-oxo-dGTP diphosphatase
MKKDKKIVIRVRGIIIDEGKLLTVKHPHSKNFLALPGGHLEWGEDVKECLQREIVEELGINPKIGKLLYLYNFINEDNIQSLEFFFEIINSQDYLNIENIERTHAYEIAEVCWIKPNDTTPLFPRIVWEDFKKGNIISDKIRYINNK